MENLENENLQNEDSKKEVKQKKIRKRKNISVDLNRSEAISVVIFGIIEAFLYTLCFAGLFVLPQISFTIFCIFTFISLSITLKQLKLIKNKKAFILGIPIFIISSFNGIFNASLFTYTNVVVIHILFAIFILEVINDEDENIYTTSFLRKIISVIFSSFKPFKKVFSSALDDDENEKHNPMFKVLIGVIISIPILVVLISLLTSADKVFDIIANKMLNNVSFSWWKIITFVFVLIYSTGYIFKAKYVSKEKYVTKFKQKNADEIIAGTVLTLLNIVFLMFSLVQFLYLFTGDSSTLTNGILPYGMTYAEYAREGFFQLLFVTIINFSVILIFINFFSNTFESKFLRTMLIMLSVFTGILIISSFYRMYLYTAEFGYTELRNRVITFLTMEMFLVIITISNFVKRKDNFAKKFIMICFTFYLIVNVTGTNYFATYLNLDRYKDGRLNVNNYYEDLENTNYEDYDSKYLLREKTDLDVVITNYDDISLEHIQNWSYLKREAFKNRDTENYYY